MKYRIIRRDKHYVIQEKFLGFLFWTDAEVHPYYPCYHSYDTFQEAEEMVSEWKNFPKDEVVRYY